MDGVAIALQAPEEAEGEDADDEADEGHHDPNAGDDGQKQLVHSVVNLEEVKEQLGILCLKPCDLIKSSDPPLYITLNE